VKAQLLDARSLCVGLIVALLVSSASVVVMAADEEHAVVGRYAVESAAGGAVWAFQSSGKLVVIGPADLMSEGAWTAVPGSASKFDATLEVTVTSQRLMILGDVSPSGSEIALYVAATPPDDEQGALPWPPESRLTGLSLSVVPELTPAPSLDAMECLRPAWSADRSIDWEPCGPPVAAGSIEVASAAEATLAPAP